MKAFRKAIGSRRAILGIVAAGLLVLGGSRAVWGQLGLPGDQSTAPNPLTDPTAKPGKVLLFDLESRFAKDTLARGGA